MTPRSVRRAAERKEKRAVSQTALHGAATPAALPNEHEPSTVLPVPDVALPEPQPAPENPRPAMCHEGLLIPGESQDDFNEFSERLCDHYMPYDQEERVLVQKLIESRWFLRRRKGVFETIEAALHAAQPDPAKWSEDDFKRMALADSYRCQAEQVAGRAQRNVDAVVRKRIEDNRFSMKIDLAFNHYQLKRKEYEFSLWKAGLQPKKSAQPGEAEQQPATKTAGAAEGQ